MTATEGAIAVFFWLFGLLVGFLHGRRQGRCEGIAACVKRQRGEPWDF